MRPFNFVQGRRAVRATPPRHVRRGRFLSSRAHAVRLFRLWYRACDGSWAPLALTCATFLASARATNRSRIPCIVAAGLHGNIEHTGSFKDRDRHFDCHFTRCKGRDRTMRPLPCSLATLALRRPSGPLHRNCAKRTRQTRTGSVEQAHLDHPALRCTACACPTLPLSIFFCRCPCVCLLEAVHSQGRSLSRRLVQARSRRHSLVHPPLARIAASPQAAATCSFRSCSLVPQPH